MEVGNVQQITAAQFGSRFKSKKEVFGFLTVELKAYLPSFHTVSIYFLKHIACGFRNRKFIIVSFDVLTDYKNREVVTA